MGLRYLTFVTLSFSYIFIILSIFLELMYRQNIQLKYLDILINTISSLKFYFLLFIRYRYQQHIYLDSIYVYILLAKK